MNGFNKVVLIGNLTKKPELRYTPQGSAVCDMRLAVNTKYKNTDQTLYVDVTAWGKQAENCEKYLGRGAAVVVEGRLSQDNWTDKETGAKRTKHRVIASYVGFITDGKGGRGGAEEAPGQEEGPQEQQEAKEEGEVPF